MPPPSAQADGRLAGTLILLCGMSFAGKSTLAAALAARTGADIVSLDAINASRGLDGGIGIAASEWSATHRIALGAAGQALAAGRSVVVDDTNCFRFLRDEYRALARRLGRPCVLLHLDPPLATLERRLRSNEATSARPRVLAEVFDDLRRKFEPPAPDEGAVVVPADVDLAPWVEGFLDREARRA